MSPWLLLTLLSVAPEHAPSARIAVVIESEATGRAARTLETMLKSDLSERLGATVVEESQLRALREAAERGAVRVEDLPALITTRDADLVLLATLELERAAGGDLLGLESYTAAIEYRVFTTDTAEQIAAGDAIVAAPGRSSRLAAERASLLAVSKAVWAELEPRLTERAERRGRVELHVLTETRLSSSDVQGVLAAVRLLPVVSSAKVRRRDPSELLVDLVGPNLDTERVAALLESGPDSTLVVERYGASQITVRHLPEKTARLYIHTVYEGTAAWRPLVEPLVRGGLSSLPFVRLGDEDRGTALETRVHRAKGAVVISSRLVQRGQEILRVDRLCEEDEARAVARCATQLADALAARLESLRGDGRLVADAPPLAAVGLGALDSPGVFSALVSHYIDHPVGTVLVANRGDAPVEVRLRARALELAEAWREGSSQTIPPGAERALPVLLDLDAEALRAVEVPRALGVELSLAVEQKSSRYRVPARRTVIVFDRNALDWSREEGRAFSSFVDGRAPAISALAERVRGTLQGREAAPLALPVGLVEALRGLKYFEDPLHPFAPTRIDFLRFPEQTLAAGGGDCDDLSVVFTSLADALGRRSLVVLTPGHVFAAVELRVPAEQARWLYPEPDAIIEHRGQAWLPLELTRAREGFDAAWSAARAELSRARSRGAASWFELEEARERYPAAGYRFSVDRSLDMDPKRVARTLTRLDDARERRLEEMIDRAHRGGPTEQNAVGVRLAKLGEIARARALFERILAESEHLPATNNLGATLLVEGHPAEALLQLRAAVARAPEALEPRLNAVLASLLTDASDEALDQLMDPVPGPALRDLWQRAAAIAEPNATRAGSAAALPAPVLARLVGRLSRRGILGLEDSRSAPLRAGLGDDARARSRIVYWLES